VPFLLHVTDEEHDTVRRKEEGKWIMTNSKKYRQLNWIFLAVSLSAIKAGGNRQVQITDWLPQQKE
jgi:hypothetical protein